VVQTHDKRFQLGDTIELSMPLTTIADPRTQYCGCVIAVGEPPHSGKSVFIAELYRQLLQRQASGILLQRACPDGEGMWSNEADPALVQSIRRKSKFSPEFVTKTLQAIENLGCNPILPLVLLDLGGKRSDSNGAILQRSTHCILISSDANELAQWQEFAIAQACEVMATFALRLVELPNQCSNQRRLVTCASLPRSLNRPLQHGC
jgi:CRISPR-associated protein Csx3